MQVPTGRLKRRRNLDLAADDLRPQRIHLGDELLRHLRTDDPDVLALVLQVEDEIMASAELPGLRELVEREDCCVHTLRSAREDVRAEIVLVGIDADAPDFLRPGGLEGAQAAAAGDGELSLRALRDVLQRKLLA